MEDGGRKVRRDCAYNCLNRIIWGLEGLGLGLDGRGKSQRSRGKSQRTPVSQTCPPKTYTRSTARAHEQTTAPESYGKTQIIDTQASMDTHADQKRLDQIYLLAIISH